MWLSGLPLAVNAVSLLASFIIVPGLGEIGWGIWSTAVGLSGATSFLTRLGVRPLFIRSLARTDEPQARRRLIGAQLALRILLALGASLIALATGLLLGYGTTILLCAAIAAAGLLPSVMWTTYSDILNAEESFRASAIASLISGVVLTVASVAAVLAGLGPVGMAFAYLVGPALTAIQLGRLVRRRGLPVLPIWESGEIRRLAREARATAAGDGLANLLTRVSGVYIPAIVGPAAYGFYNTGNLLVTRLQNVGDSVVTAYTPVVSRDVESLRAGRSTWSSRTLLRLLLCVGVMLGVGALAVAAWFVGLIYRDPASADAAASALAVMAVVSASLPLTVLALGWRQLLIAADLQDTAAQVGAVAAALGALLTFGLTWRFGVVGAAAGLVGTAAVSAVVLGFATRRHLGAVAAVPSWLGGALAYLVGGATAWLAVDLGTSLAGAAVMVAAPVVTGAALFALGVIRMDELRQWWQRVRPPAAT